MEELAKTLTLLRASGKVKTFGVSNMSVSQIELLQSFLDEPLFSNQVRLGLDHPLLFDLEVWVNREESPKNSGMGDFLSYSAKNKMSIQAYSPLAQGRYSKPSSDQDKKIAKLINTLAEKYQSSSTGILLAWLWRIPTDIHPIIGTTNLNRIQESVNAMKINLSREDWYDLWITSKGAKLP
jgi:predicted oxidoreductase